MAASPPARYVLLERSIKASLCRWPSSQACRQAAAADLVSAHALAARFRRVLLVSGSDIPLVVPDDHDHLSLRNFHGVIKVSRRRFTLITLCLYPGHDPLITLFRRSIAAGGDSTEAMMSAQILSEKAGRLHALDAVRCFAMLLGIALHGVTSFLREISSLPNWPIYDISPSTTLSVPFFVIHVFRMFTFFIMSGFFAHMMLDKRGLAQFTRDRARRVLLPLVGGWLLCVPLVVLTMIWARTIRGMPPPPPSTNTLPQLMHLWFLYVLLWLYGSAILCRYTFRFIDTRDRVFRRIERLFAVLVRSLSGAALLAVPLGLMLVVMPRERWIWMEGVQTPDRLIPLLPSYVIYAIAFWLGWMLYRQQQLLTVVARRWPINIAIGSLAALGYLLYDFNRKITLLSSLDRFDRPIFAISYSIAMVCLSLGLVGIGIRFFRNEKPVIRYLADASYWMYIIHIPVVLALQSAFMRVELHWTIKFPLIVLLTFTLLIVSYRYLVRSTWIGLLLNGKRYPRTVQLHSSAA